MKEQRHRILCAVCALALVLTAVLAPAAWAADGAGEVQDTAKPTLTTDDAAEMQQADAAVTALTGSDEYEQMSREERLTSALAELDELARKGLVRRDSIRTDEENGIVSFTYRCGVLGGILLILTVSGIVLFLSCALGWVVAQISRKLRNKSLITVLVSLIFIGAYYFFYAKAQSLMQDLIANADSYGAKIRGAAYPLYLLGRMGVGDPVALLVWIAGTALVLFLTLYIIARGFIRLATSTGTVARTAYREKKARVASPAGALRRREFARFLGSPTYMLNCGLGSVIGVAFAGFLLIRNSWAYENLSVLSEAVGIGIPRFAPIAAAAVCMVLSTIAITAPSVSLEGRTIWLSQSLPVTPWQVLRAKLAVHLWVGGIPALLCGVAVAAALRLPFPTAVMTVILPLLFTLLQACFGLFVNLLHPNLTWVSEMTPIKQSLGVLFSLLGGWGYAALLGIGGYFLTVPVPAWVALLALNLLTALLSLLLLRWLKGRGARIFAAL